MRTQFLLLVIGAALLFTGCKEKKDNVDNLGRANAPGQTSSPQAMPQPTPQPGSAGKIHHGVIEETIDVASYTYIRFKDKQGLDHWAAVLKGKFEVGKEISIVESIVQKDFTSPTLKRTFKSIVFGNATTGEEKPSTPPSNSALPEGHPPIPVNTGTDALPEGHPPLQK